MLPTKLLIRKIDWFVQFIFDSSIGQFEYKLLVLWNHLLMLQPIFNSFKDACTVKAGFKPVPPQLYFEFAALFLHWIGQKKSGKFKIKLWRNWFQSNFYCASIFTKVHIILNIWKFAHSFFTFSPVKKCVLKQSFHFLSFKADLKVVAYHGIT